MYIGLTPDVFDDPGDPGDPGNPGEGAFSTDFSTVFSSDSSTVIVAQINGLNVPPVPHVAVGKPAPLPLYPASHVMVTASPVLPVISAVPEALSELATLAVVHASAVHVIALKVPLEPHVAVNVVVPAYPVSHVTSVVSPVLPVIAPVVFLLLLATSVAVQLLMSQQSDVTHVSLTQMMPANVDLIVKPASQSLCPKAVLPPSVLSHVGFTSQQSDAAHVSVAHVPVSISLR